jgi:hypothetical protein
MTRDLLRRLIDELEASVIAASDAELIAESRFPWVPGRTAAEARAVLDAALRAERAPRTPGALDLPAPWRTPLPRHRD